MPTKTHRPYTETDKQRFQQERQERMDGLAQQLEQGIAAIQSGDAFKRYLRTAAKFHRYSFGNTLLILCQCPDATQVAGYTTWQQLGRQIRKGETGIRIFAP